MYRINLPARPDWQTTLANQGLSYHSAAGAEYWKDGHCFMLTQDDSDKLDNAVIAFNEMLHNTVKELVESGRIYTLLNPVLNGQLVSHMVTEFKTMGLNDDQYGRFDFAFDKVGAVRMFEYNADTPVTLIESAYAQWEWFMDRCKEGHLNDERFFQNNYIYDHLLEMFTQYKGRTMMVICKSEQVSSYLEYEATALYLTEVAKEAGVKAFFRFVDDMDLDPFNMEVIDPEFGKPDFIFKLYPTEWLVKDLENEKCDDPIQLFRANNFIERPWKLLLGGKFMLPELYRIYGDKYGIIPAWHTREECMDKKVVAKPYYGRIGDVEILDPGQLTTMTEPVIYQEFIDLPTYGDDNVKVTIGTFMIQGKPSGFGIRQQVADVTNDTCWFAPHVVECD